MKKSITAVAASLIALATASADPISGSIAFTGGVTLDTQDAGTAIKVMQWTSATGPGMPTVLSDTGSFAAFVAPGTAAAFNPAWLFDTTSQVNNFWSVGGFVFNLVSSQITSQKVGVGVTVSGMGFITGPAGSGLDSTPGTWTFSATDPATGMFDENTPIFTFQGLTPAPDGGMTLVLLGASLSGLALAKRKIKA
ncbi:MAG TPA: hypothetical protein VH413_03990 [Verrucomicrobiae bacterium]|jgi:hypothetical protein|nr:hypothetical protein [Verrucomicrobiae bacterium]